jgi:hypothetical protein
MEVTWEETREETMQQLKLSKFAKDNFINGNTLAHTKDSIKGPLLTKSKELDKMVVWRFGS